MHHYDVLPYESNPFRATHPQSLAMLGSLFKLTPADPMRCRLLELGCAAGGNLLPMAWHLPDSEFIGIDLELRQIQDGQALVDELGLKNIRLAQGDIMALGDELGDELGQFDYIVAHGVYSWIPQPVREAMLALYKRLLKPQGIAYISYNTRPGWHVRGMLREILLYHIRDVEDPIARLNQANEMIELLGNTLAGQAAPLAQHLLIETNYLKTSHPSYIYHEYLETNNEPVLVSEFLALAKQHGLGFLCESQLYSMFASALGPEVETFLSRFEDQATHEQYLDLLTQRTFRQTLLCHDDVQPDYDIDLLRLEQFACYANLQPPQKPDLRHAKAQEFLTQEGKPVAVADPMMKAMLVVLYEEFPSALALPELLEKGRQGVQSALGKKPMTDDNFGWRDELFNLFANGLLQLCLEPQTHSNRIPDKPRLNNLVRTQLKHGSINITTVWHESLNTDAFSRQLAGYLDGNHDRPALLQQLLQDVADGTLSLPGLPDNPQKRAQSMAFNLERMLTLFARNGILME